MAERTVTPGPVASRPADQGRRRPRPLMVWVLAPWLVAVLLILLALRLLALEDFNLQASGWGLLGSAAICFSIGCVCRVSLLLAERR
ncbi:hypothetical protein [Synechococcus sp. ATX 2A4]|uniref:hypothetical protein n=1 Tax=Synechococcus sp. ATX 2A4 TaxID=2823727 RepID=UPI0020CF4B2B|nr:hypothetical protein [Synechococcus sp. ATX 2A4]